MNCRVLKKHTVNHGIVGQLEKIVWLPFIVLFLSISAVILHLKNKMNLLKNREYIKGESNYESEKLLIFWMDKKRKEKDIAFYLKKKGIERIAIYGMAWMGVLLFYELKDTDITVVCGIDRIKKDLNTNLEILRPEEFDIDVDAIIVTPIYYFSDIYDILVKKVGKKTKILGLDEIIYNIYC